MTDRSYVLYRAFDNYELLYIGLSMNVIMRLNDQRSASLWWDRVTRIELTQIPGALDRASALAVEAEAIRNEEPPFNCLGNPRWKSPEIQALHAAAATTRVKTAPIRRTIKPQITWRAA